MSATGEEPQQAGCFVETGTCFNVAAICLYRQGKEVGIGVWGEMTYGEV